MACQVTKHRMAEMKTQITVGRTFADHCLELHAEKRLDATLASMAKCALALPPPADGAAPPPLCARAPWERLPHLAGTG
jgi:hypothetical protein